MSYSIDWGVGWMVRARRDYADPRVYPDAAEGYLPP